MGSTPAGTRVSQWWQLATGRASGQNCSLVPIEVLYIPILVGAYQFSNKGVNDVKFGR